MNGVFSEEMELKREHRGIKIVTADEKRSCLFSELH